MKAASQPVPPSIHLLRCALSPAARWRAFQWWPTRMNIKGFALWGNLKLYEAVQQSFVWLCVALDRGLEKRSSTFSVRASSSCTEQVSCPTLWVFGIDSGFGFLVAWQSVIRDRNALPEQKHECHPHSLMSGKLTG